MHSNSKRRGVFFISALVIMLIISGCGDKSQTAKSVLNYEQPAVTMIRAVKLLDTKSYLNCFTPGAREKYEKSENYNSRLAEVLLPRQETVAAPVKIKTLSAEELEGDAVSQLEADYREMYSRRISISKAYKLSVEISTFQNGKGASDIRDITVINNGRGWLIYGDIIEEFNFNEKQAKIN